MNPPCFSFWAGAPRRRGPCRGDASGGQLSFAEKKAGKESRQRKPIPRRFPLESFPDGQGGNRAAVSPIGSSFPGKGGDGSSARNNGTRRHVQGCGRLRAGLIESLRRCGEGHPEKQTSVARSMVSGAEAHIPSACSPSRQSPLRFSALRTGGAGAEPRRALSPVSLAQEKPGRRRQSPSGGKGTSRRRAACERIGGRIQGRRCRVCPSSGASRHLPPREGRPRGGDGRREFCTV